jgi:hypothetical protein
MVFIHFFESGKKVLTQYLNTVPAVDEPIKIKGRKGKVLRVDQIEDHIIHVHILYDQIVKKGLLADPKKKKR